MESVIHALQRVVKNRYLHAHSNYRIFLELNHAISYHNPTKTSNNCHSIYWSTKKCLRKLGKIEFWGCSNLEPGLINSAMTRMRYIDPILAIGSSATDWEDIWLSLTLLINSNHFVAKSKHPGFTTEKPVPASLKTANRAVWNHEWLNWYFFAKSPANNRIIKNFMFCL